MTNAISFIGLSRRASVTIVVFALFGDDRHAVPSVGFRITDNIVGLRVFDISARVSIDLKRSGAVLRETQFGSQCHFELSRVGGEFANACTDFTLLQCQTRGAKCVEFTVGELLCCHLILVELPTEGRLVQVHFGAFMLFGYDAIVCERGLKSKIVPFSTESTGSRLS